jgi:cytochrome c oxidase subunit III
VADHCHGRPAGHGVWLATWFNDLKAARPESHGPLIFFVGSLLVAYMMFGWFGAVIKESRAGLYSRNWTARFAGA